MGRSQASPLLSGRGGVSVSLSGRLILAKSRPNRQACLRKKRRWRSLTHEPIADPDPAVFRRPGRRLLSLRPPAFSYPGGPQSAAGGHRCLENRPSGPGGGDLFRPVCGGRGSVPARGSGPHSRRWGSVRAGGGYPDRLLRLQPGGHPGLLGSALCAAQPRQRAFRRPPAGHRPRHRPQRHLLSAHPAPGAGVSVLRRQPGDGADDDAGPHLLLGEPTGHVARNHRLRQRRYPAGQDRISL